MSDCFDCEYLDVVISQIEDYRCSMKKEYMSFADFCCDCEFYKKGELDLVDKEEIVWGY